MTRTAIVSLRIFQGLLALANLGLSAYVVNWYLVTTRRGSPPSLNFLAFASALSLLSLPYLELAPRLGARGLGHPCACLGVEACNTLFYFAAFIAHAFFLGGLAICRGTVCTVGRVDSVIAAAAFCAWSASAMLSAKTMFVKGTPHRPNAAHQHHNQAYSAKAAQMQDV